MILNITTEMPIGILSTTRVTVQMGSPVVLVVVREVVLEADHCAAVVPASHLNFTIRVLNTVVAINELSPIPINASVTFINTTVYKLYIIIKRKNDIFI